MPPDSKPRIGNLEGGIILLIAFLLWALMVLLSLTGFGEVGSEFIALIGSGMFAAWFWVRGAYKDKAALQNLMTTLGGTVVDLIPFVNDFPIMIIEVAAVLVVTRIEDIRVAKENIQKKAAAVKTQQQVAVQQQAASIAVANANAMREQALTESKARALQDAERAAQQAANDNEEEESEDEFSQAA